MLALLQRITTFLTLATAVGWLAYFGRSAPMLAWAGCAVLVFGYSALFALEFVIASQINRQDPTDRAGWRDHFAAWWGETLIAPRVFCWRQPFRPNAVADHLEPQKKVWGRRGVVFVHGFFCNRGFWTPWLECLQSRGNAFIAVDLEPLFGSIDSYAAQIDEAIKQVTRATGLAPLLVCHSMGGLAARAWLKRIKHQDHVHHVVTIGTPHRGTWLARFGHGENSRQMRLASSWYAEFSQATFPGRQLPFTCWYSNCDNIVFPASNATLPGACNRLLHGVGHVQMAFLPEVMQATWDLLDDNPP